MRLLNTVKQMVKLKKLINIKVVTLATDFSSYLTRKVEMTITILNISQNINPWTGMT